MSNILTNTLVESLTLKQLGIEVHHRSGSGVYLRVIEDPTQEMYLGSCINMEGKKILISKEVTI
jgi:hypothetical protein